MQLGGPPTKLNVQKGKGGIEINVGSGIGHHADNADYYAHTSETRAFQQVGPSLLLSCLYISISASLKSWEDQSSMRRMQEFETAKKRQDKALDNIEKGVATLKGIGEAMGETMAQQDVLIDAIDERVGMLLRSQVLQCFDALIDILAATMSSSHVMGPSLDAPHNAWSPAIMPAVWGGAADGCRHQGPQDQQHEVEGPCEQGEDKLKC